VFTLQQPLQPIPWNGGERPTAVIIYRDVRGNRQFLIRPRYDKYDIRIVAQGVVTADREQISGKQVEMAARTLGITLTQDNLQVLVRSAQHQLARPKRAGL